MRRLGLGPVVNAGLPNKRLKLTGRLSEEAYVCAPASWYRSVGCLRPPALAPQLKRDPLGGWNDVVFGGTHMRSSILFTLLGIALVSCGPDETVALRVDETVALRVQVVIPANVPTIGTGQLYLSLWSYDPGIADVGATLVDVGRTSFAHALGERDVLQMRVGGHITGGWRPYITVEGCQATPQGMVAVLWDGLQETGTPSSVEMQYRTTTSSCQGATR